MDPQNQFFFISAVTICLVIYSLYKVTQPSRRSNDESSGEVPVKPAPEYLDGDLYDSSDLLFGSTTTFLSEMMPVTKKGQETLTKALRNAGYFSPHAWENFSAVWLLIMMGTLFAFGGLLVVVPKEFETAVIIGLVVGTGLAWAIPSLYIRNRAVERLRLIGNGMPDMLDLLNMCVAQGMTVTSALRRVGNDIRSVYPALSKEMSIVTEQANAGSLTQGLKNFSQRVDTPEVHSFSNLLIQTEKMGTSVSEALSEYSDGMRQSMKQRADQKANAAAFKLLFPTVLCLMPAVYLFLMGPSVVELNQFFDGGATSAFQVEIPEQFAQ